jgi:hypothetical protein
VLGITTVEAAAGKGTFDDIAVRARPGVYDVVFESSAVKGTSQAVVTYDVSDWSLPGVIGFHAAARFSHESEPLFLLRPKCYPHALQNTVITYYCIMSLNKNTGQN